jgi:hypothetical protein
MSEGGGRCDADEAAAKGGVMEQGEGAQFEAEAQIGKGMRFIDRHGRAIISDGRLVLHKENGELIASAPTADVWADKARMSGGGAARVWIGDESFSVQALHIYRTTAGFTPGGMAAANIGRDIKRIKRGREFTQQFLQALEAEGAHIGKPT